MSKILKIDGRTFWLLENIIHEPSGYGNQFVIEPTTGYGYEVFVLIGNNGYILSRDEFKTAYDSVSANRYRAVFEAAKEKKSLTFSLVDWVRPVHKHWVQMIDKTK